MILLIVKLVLMGETIALTAIPTNYTSIAECEQYAYQASIARRDDVSEQTTLMTSCMDSKEMFK